MENLLIKYIFASLAISITIFFIVTKYGVEHFNKVNAATFVFGSLVFGLTLRGLGVPFDYVFNYYTGGFVLFVAILALIFSRIMAFLTAFGLLFLLFLCLNLSIMPSSLIENRQFFAIFSLLLPSVGLFLSRKYIIKITVGLWSGFYVCAILYDILVLIAMDQIININAALVNPKIATTFTEFFYLINIVVIIFCVYFQLAMHEKVFGKKVESA